MKVKPFFIMAHFGGWLLLYLLPYLFAFEGLPNIFTMFSHPGDYIHLLSFSLVIAFSYFNFHWLYPTLYIRHKYVWYALTIIASFYVVIQLPMEIISPPHMPTGLPPLKDEPKPLLFGRNYSILVFIISVFASHTIHTRLQLQLFEKQQLHAKLSLLQAQINPHFLFNTLNSIYALVIQKDDKAADAIVHLSEMMRYTLHNSNANEIDLQTEVNYAKNYIALQQARLGNTVVVQEEIAGDFTGRKIAPLLLITFIENAFKHGVNPNKPSVISIAINDQLPGLNLFVSNQKVNSPQDENGIGLKNIQSRLQLLYADRYSLHIDDTATQYAVTLTIDLL